MIWKLCLVVLLARTSLQFTLAVSEDAMTRCHTGDRNGSPRCQEYANLAKREVREAARRRVVRQADGGDMEPPNCDDFSDTDYYDTCVACEEGTLTGDDCLPPEQDGGSEGGDGDREPPNCDDFSGTDFYDTCVACREGTVTGDDCRPEREEEDVDYPTLPDYCITGMEWGDGTEHTAADNFGNCMVTRLDDTHRYITSNNVPDFYYNPYCPIGLGQGYCIPQEYEKDACFFEGLVCGGENMGTGTTPYGDVWVAQEDSYKIKLEGNPTQSDRPGDMYDARRVDAAKTTGVALGVAINGIGIYGPNDAGDVSIDEAGFQLACGGHVTPPEGNDEVPGASTPPKYHYHKAAECLEPFRNASKGLAVGGTPLEHASLMGWAIDGFGIYAYQDAGGVTPVVDECGGHFGHTDTGEVVYHYHQRAIVPYTLACQGPALGKCEETQRGTSYCHPGCGAEVCVQPGTDPRALEEYLGKWNSTWLESYTVNDFTKGTQWEGWYRDFMDRKHKHKKLF